MQDGTLTLVFAELRQLLDLFLEQDWSGFLADHGQERSKYGRVTPGTAAALMEKVLEMERKGSGPGGLFAKTKDKDRRKLLETVLKQLRALNA